MLCGILFVLCICSCGKDTASYIQSETEPSQKTETEIEKIESQETDTEGTDAETEEVLLYVYVCGEIQCSGVYTLPTGSRVCDLFAAAGGLTENAAVEYWNQASLLTDGQMLYVPSIEEAMERGLENSSAAADTNDTSGKINLNTATLEQLMQIPGIGEAKAKAILNYRETNGGFSSIEEVMNIEGIKEGVFSKMKEYIVVN